MHSGICPECGYFNNRQAEIDVSQYFSAKFDDDGGKVSTSAQAARQHEKLHEMYDKYNMHKQGAHQSGTYQPGAAQGRAGNIPQPQRIAPHNPYQQSSAQGSAYRTGRTGGAVRPAQTGTYRQGTSGQPVRSGAYRQSDDPQRGKYGQAKLYEKEKEKNIVTPVCAVIAVLAIVSTIAVCSLKKREIAEIYQTVDFEQETAEAGQIFEINGRLMMVEKAEVVDTSMMSGISEAEKLMAVTVEILPAENWDGGWADHIVYLSDGYTCRQCLDSYALGSIVTLDEFPDGGDPYAIMEEFYDMRQAMEEDILTGSDYLDYSSAEGKTGKFYFVTDKEAESVTISFDQEGTKNGVSVLEKRVSVPLMPKEVS